jgi:hypothetical protein
MITNFDRKKLMAFEPMKISCIYETLPHQLYMSVSCLAVQ